jgi:2-methylcitrate dehydratase PrpD
MPRPSRQRAAGATARLTEFVTDFGLEHASTVLVARAKDLLVDVIAVAIAAVSTEVAGVAAALQPAVGSDGPVSVLGRARTHDPASGAFFNASLAHALEFDDSTLAPVGHPSCVIVPALFALAESEGRSGADLLSGYLTGMEVHSRLGQAQAGAWSSEGFWLPIGHVSVMGAAAGCSRMLGLDRAQTSHALGLATQFAGGLTAGSSTMAKPLGAGAAARAGLEAALLARAGATGPSEVVERANGFADIFLGSGHDLDGALSSLGSPHHLEEVGIAVKRYPSAYATHWGIDALLLLMDEHALGPSDIETITLEHPEAAAFCDHPAPATSEQARFSHQFNLAIAVIEGMPGPDSYGQDRITRRDVTTMLGKIACRSHPPHLEPPKSWQYLVIVETAKGQSLSKSVPRPLGHPRNPMDAKELESKFYRCVEGHLPMGPAERLLELLRHVEAEPDMTGISAQLQAIRPAGGTPGRGARA